MRPFGAILWGLTWMWVTQPRPANAQDTAVVVGIGAVRMPTEATEAGAAEWESRLFPEARTEAEDVFRRLIPATRFTPDLYAHTPHWRETGSRQWEAALLLTERVTDNAAIPVVSHLIWEFRRMGQALRPRDRLVLYLAAPGSPQAWDTWIYGRLGKRVNLRTLIGELPMGSGSRILVVRVHSADSSERVGTLLALDAGTADAVRAWQSTGRGQADAGEVVTVPIRLLPGLDQRLQSMSPTRALRFCEALDGATQPHGGLEMWDLGETLEPVPHRVEADLDVREIPVFRTVRRPGPLFTIIEEETDEQIGTRYEMDREALELLLTNAGIAGASARRIAIRIRTGLADSFRETLDEPEADYEIAYDKVGGRCTVVYDD